VSASFSGSAVPEGFDPHAVPVRNAATVMLVRDTAQGLEVFMLRRTLKAVFVGGFYVFPGGAVDAADSGPEVDAISPHLDDAEASAALGIETGGLAYWVAAIRECFEEAGVLLAAQHDGQLVRFDDPTAAERFTQARHAVHDGNLRMVDLCASEGLYLDTGDIQYVSHWITPVGEPRRFDTRFFVARAPEAQEPLHDDNETIASLWVNPADALARADAGELAMIVPTRRNLEFLVPHATAADVLAAASRVGRPPAIQPRIVTEADGSISVLLPGEPGYAAAP
jgi:8-oxo-dGTP pyrophosphatase MutT (NUDIX family)